MKTCFRRVFAEPLTASAIVVILALGLGITTAAFAFLDDLLLSPFTTFIAPSRVLEIAWTRPGGSGVSARLPLSYAEFLDLRDNRAFSLLAAAQNVSVLCDAAGRSARVGGEMVSSGFFRLGGVDILRGRGFGPSEEGFAPVVVLGYDFWRRALGGDEGILGRRIRLNGHPFTVIGVAGPRFKGLNRFAPADLWVPVSMYRQVFMLPDVFEQRDGRVLRVFGRIRPGLAKGSAMAELELLGARLAQKVPKTNPPLRLEGRDLASAAASPSTFQKQLWEGGGAALGVTAALLFIACLDTANLLLVRARARTRESAIRLALGAGPWRLALRELGDGLLLATLGGLLAGPIAIATRHALWRLRPPYLDERLINPGLGSRTLLFALALTLLTTLLSSGTSILHLWRTDPRSLLREAAGPDRASFWSWLSGQVLVIAQIALSAACLGMAALFLSDLWRSLAWNPGFETRRLVLVSFDLQLAGYGSPRVHVLEESLAQKLRALPGIASVALAENRLLGGFRIWRGVTRPGTAGDPQAPMAGSTRVGEGYFTTVGIPLLQGSGFETSGEAGQPIVLNEALARRLFPHGDAVGRDVMLDEDSAPYRVVGVAATSSYLAVREDPLPLVYLPLARSETPRFTIHLRTSGDPAATLAAVRQAVLSVDPQIPIEEIVTMQQALRQSQWMPLLSGWILSMLAAVAVALAGFGVYGVASATAQRRRHEIGVRMALGARRKRLVGSLLVRGLGGVGLGLAAGLLLTAWIERWIQSLLYGAGPLGWPAAASVAFVLLLAGGAAHLVPALRETGRSPALVLREI